MLAYKWYDQKELEAPLRPIAMFLGGGFGRIPTTAQVPVMSQRLGKRVAGHNFICFP